VDKDKRLVGVVHFNNIREIILIPRVKYTLVKNIMAVPTEIIYPFNTMETVMNKFERSKLPFNLVKMINTTGLYLNQWLEAYRTKLKSMTIE
jgi:CIC family chloride channel protein